MVTKENGLDATTEFTSYRKDEVSQYLRRLEEQLSLTEDSIKEIDPLCSEERATDNTELLEYEKQIPKEDNSANLLFRPEYFVNNQSYGGHAGMQLQTNNLVHLQDAGLWLGHVYEIELV